MVIYSMGMVIGFGYSIFFYSIMMVIRFRGVLFVIL